MNCQKLFNCIYFNCDTDCVLLARTQLKYEEFFATNSKYVVYFNKFFRWKRFFLRFPAFENLTCVNFELNKFAYVG